MPAKSNDSTPVKVQDSKTVKVTDPKLVAKTSKPDDSKSTKVEEVKTATKGKPDDSKSTKVEEVKTATKGKPVETKTNASKKEDKVMIKEVDDESDDADDDDDEDDDEEDDEEEEDDGKQTEGDKKEKKAKKTWEEISNEWDENCVSLKENEAEYKALLEKVRVNQKTRAELDRKRNTLYSLMSKSKDDEVKKASKLKPKREGNKNGGFNREKPVPKVLVKYLGLEDGVTMSRPKLMSALTAKFKAAGLKTGQTTTLDKTASKALGKENGRVIAFTGFQPFLAEFFNEEEAGTVTL
jgi:hypothetical protein